MLYSFLLILHPVPLSPIQYLGVTGSPPIHLQIPIFLISNFDHITHLFKIFNVFFFLVIQSPNRPQKGLHDLASFSHISHDAPTLKCIPHSNQTEACIFLRAAVVSYLYTFYSSVCSSFNQFHSHPLYCWLLPTGLFHEFGCIVSHLWTLISVLCIKFSL